jgi:hypothetical protein
MDDTKNFGGGGGEKLPISTIFQNSGGQLPPGPR